jgi:CBS domain containing-hemolysin-like protein
VVRIWPTTSRIVATALSFVIVTLLTVVLSELLPKAVTLRHIVPAAMLTAIPVLHVERAMRPLVWLMTKLGNAVTRPLGLGRVDDLEKQEVTIEELRLLASRAAEAGTLSARERSLILNSLAIGRRAARDIMVPRVRVSFLDLQWPMEKNRQVLNTFLHSRLPLCNGGMDKVIGLVRTKEFLAAYHAAAESNVLSLIALPAVFAPSLVSLDKLLALMQDKRTEFVFLVDEHGGVDGIVTLQDVVDELVGEIHPHTPA